MRRNVPEAGDNEIRTGMSVLFCRENPVNRWTGPFRILAFDEKQMWLNADGRNVLAFV